MVNILISGYYGFDNIGDESILRTLVSSLREHIPDCSLTVLSHPPPRAKNTASRRWTACRRWRFYAR
jgi:polysaccharide pyruvyl transferase WcaK-like protein